MSGGKRGGGGRSGGGRPGGRSGAGGGRGRGANRHTSRGGERRGGPPTERARGRTGIVGDGGPGGTSELGGDQVEGINAVRELLVAGTRKVHELVVATERKDDALDDLVELAGQFGVAIREAGRNKMDAIARTTAHQGVVAMAARLRETEFEELLAGDGTTPPFLLAADGITDPGNLGALLRTAAAAGVTGIVLPRHRAAHITPAVTKAAAGAIEHLRMAVVPGLPKALATASAHAVVSIGLDMDGDTSLHAMPPLDQPVMVVVGAEGRGLGRLVRERCEVVASIPMAGPTESLNASVAGALAMYEVVRQRNA